MAFDPQALIDRIRQIADQIAKLPKIGDLGGKLIGQLQEYVAKLTQGELTPEDKAQLEAHFAELTRRMEESQQQAGKA